MPIKKELDDINSSHVFLRRTYHHSQIIYLVVLCSVAVVLCSLPFIYITINVGGRGSIYSDRERISITAPVSGRISYINLKDNLKVDKGALLLSIDNHLLDQQNTILSRQNDYLQKLLRDVEIITKDEKPAHNLLQTRLYISDWQYFLNQQQSALYRSEQARINLNRYQILFTKKAVTKVEYELYKFNYEQSLLDWRITNKKIKTQWQSEAIQYRKELAELQAQKLHLSDQYKLFDLIAPISGFIQNLVGLQTGVYVFANEKIAEISFNSTLYAFCYLKPSDIAFIKVGQSVNFQIDSFNHYQWGLLMGKVIDVSDDVVIKDQIPYYKIKCQLNKNYLQLHGGYKGYLKKGMTFSARFIITERNLYELLYDKVDDWI